MKVTSKGIELIKLFESFQPKAYKCPAGVWTIGYGTTIYQNGVAVKSGDVCTKEQATTYLFSDVSRFEKAINNNVKVALTSNQFDALVSFVYNVGIGAFESSTLLKKLNISPNDVSIQKEFLKWNKANGKILPGLTRRRTAESNLYFTI